MDVFDQINLMLLAVAVTIVYVEFETIKRLFKRKKNAAR